ncbi:MAG TPA: bifunctional alpha,alpha-trehalose-phosphate synthase (UDP-forming)/trehalose-phosphatase [Chitinophagaceae bacterium]|nr:bifunctional alpha,alpha-trehalose-phosphate synthase (UDP-forming)/trehalose-phosphatase [Chitinophagaceae bacterium]
MVSNHLPVAIDSSGSDLRIITTSGGLITAINSFLRRNKSITDHFSHSYWVGVPECSPATWSKAESLLPAATFEYLPVFINKNIFEKYYDGFCNTAIWPLFHYFPSFAEFNEADFDNYLKANQSFLDVIINNARQDDIIWIHDYHLLPLAELIRREIPRITIGFFLHIPFPTFEMLRLMPHEWQQRIIKGMLGADLIGFQTIDYTSHFLESVRMFLGIDHEMNIIRYDDRLIKADVFPISIDFDRFNKAYDDPNGQRIKKMLKEKFSGMKVIFSVDRLDYTKGVKNRLDAYELFLSRHREFHEQVVFILVVVPSRHTLPKYAERKKIINELVGRINSQTGNVRWQPIVHQYTSLSFEEMVGFYVTCDVALITPLRDGMNLVAKEFVASRQDKKGVLILSELAGAARELTDALTINPNDTKELAEKISEAFSMNVEEQHRRIETMQARIKQYDIFTWADDFLAQLKNIKKKQQEFQVKFMDDVSRMTMLEHYRKARTRLFLLDYDGTLVNYFPSPLNARPGHALLELLGDIASQSQNDLFIISGRDRNILEKWFGQLPLNIIAEHGASLKLCGTEWRDLLIEKRDWKADIKKIMDSYVKRCANTSLEEKRFSILWHFRNANAQQAKLRASELIMELNQFGHNLGLQVILGNKIVEVKNKEISKEQTVRNILSKWQYDFILAAGDDVNDEEVFRVLAGNENAFTFKIGGDASFAKYNLHTPQMVLSTLHTLNHIMAYTK